jgi:dephospho-CoA kinase
MNETAKRPLIIGLTGSIGMGKSTVAAMFLRAGIPVFDADAEVRAMQGPGGELIPEIEQLFPGTTGPQGVNRDELGAHIFADHDARARLEALVHPAISRRRSAFVEKHSHEPLLLFDIPLLFERNGHLDVDQTIVVSAPADIQRERVLTREGMTKEKFAHILSIQLPDEVKRARADHIIETGVPMKETESSVAKLIEELKAQSAAS